MNAVRDTVLRMGLAAMAADHTSPLTSAQRAWIIALPERTTPLTSSERYRLKAPLLAWVTVRMPNAVEIVECQFSKEVTG